uniref:Uncharacterized protein n=1 Tax=Arundo donax TaxID=35708 RepID=A0A0A9L8B9_ARUDO
MLYKHMNTTPCFCSTKCTPWLPASLEQTTNVLNQSTHLLVYNIHTSASTGTVPCQLQYQNLS